MRRGCPSGSNVSREIWQRAIQSEGSQTRKRMTPMAEFLVLFDLKCDARFCAALCQFCAAEFLSRLRHVRRISRNALVLNSSPMHKNDWEGMEKPVR